MCCKAGQFWQNSAELGLFKRFIHSILCHDVSYYVSYHVLCCRISVHYRPIQIDFSMKILAVALYGVQEYVVKHVQYGVYGAKMFGFY